MSWMWEKIQRATHHLHPDNYAEGAVRILADEIEELDKSTSKRLHYLEHADEIEADRRAEMTTAERCREDNERI